MDNLKRILNQPSKLSPGHRSCRGCAAPLIARHILREINQPVVVASATGCLEVTTSLYPQTAWRIPWIHSAFENAAATISGVESAYRALKKKGKIKKEIKFVVFGGDGGTTDIGLQSLSGALERRHNFLYICYDNGAYMNTGIQRSSATPFGAATTTTPVGKVKQGKELLRKDLTKIIVAHQINYVAQASIGYWQDLSNKVKKALAVKGPSFINVLSPCPLGWKFSGDLTIKIADLAVDTCFWPLYEVKSGVYKITHQPLKKIPITEFLKPQGRFRHLFKP
ncbi:MAG: pyruvate ferredoxin oxidoreductase, partial [Candidatus Aenigmarchaeota archaeon]|nr:pyruvate ferredoxin oxidoreductase [Candidatus Aenigmarchaeota archaeon]